MNSLSVLFDIVKPFLKVDVGLSGVLKLE